MTELQQVIRLLDTLSPEEFAQVRDYFDELTFHAHPARGKTPQERVQLLREGLEEFREGLSWEELKQIVWAMNIEEVNPDNFPAGEQ